MKKIYISLILIITLLNTNCIKDFNQPDAPEGYVKTAPLFDNLGNFHYKISTKYSLAQKYFNQGLILSYGFNHAEAARSFKEAQKIDPEFAMAYWGESLVYGPNINSSMEEENIPKAWEALQKALIKMNNGTQKEIDLIKALSKRYSPGLVENRSQLDLEYSNAMRKVANRYKDDLDIQILFAESLMNTTPWDYWLDDESPKPITTEILSVLEEVLENDPRHPQANHLYIHIVEAVKPEKAIKSADILRDLVLGAGHLLHMPSHIYIRVGRYEDATLANEKAIIADNEYIAQCKKQGLYPLAYVPHVHHFLWSSASFEGKSIRSISAAKHVSNHVDKFIMRKDGMGTLQHFYILPIYAYLKFGFWQEIMNTPKPEQDLLYPSGIWHFAQGLAQLRTGNLDKSYEHLNKLNTIKKDKSLEKITIWDINTTKHLLNIASEILTGEIHAFENDYKSSIHHLKLAVELEDALNYDEPSPWYSSTRHTLGAILLEGGKFIEAESVYREDLNKYPSNGWSLFGLQLSLVKQNKIDEAMIVQEEFRKSWENADIVLTSSRF